MASLFIVALAWFSLTTLFSPDQVHISASAYLGLTFPVLICLYGYGFILGSKTTLTNEKVIQSWIFNKEVLLKEITQIKLIHFHYLSWLIVPRIIVRTQRGVYVFQTANHIILQNFQQLAYGIKNTESK